MENLKERREGKRLPKLAYIGLCVVFLAGCNVAYSTKPLGGATVAVSPDEWEGTWIHKDGALVVAVVDEAKGILEVGWVEKKQGRLVFESYRVELRGAGEWLFGNVEDPDKPGRYVWGRIAREDGQVMLWVPDVDRVKALVKAGVLPGRLDKDGEDVILTGVTAAHLEAIISGANGPILDWQHPLVFLRLAE